MIKLKKFEILSRKDEENKIVIWPDIPYWIFVDQNTANIIKTINGLELQDAVDECKEKINSNITIEDIQELLSFLKSQDLIETKENEEIPQNDVYALQYITLNITDCCNLYCKHCYINASGSKKYFMSYEEACTVIGYLKPIAVDTCNIIVSGGEALLNKDCMEILRYISNSTKWKITLVSNGTLINDDMANNLSQIKNLAVQISLDGASENVHDFIRGKGNYRRTIEALNCLSKYDIELYLSPIVTKGLFNELEDYFELAKRYHVKAVFLQPINCVGRAKENKLQRINDADVFKKVIDIYNKDPDLKKITPGTLESRYVSNIRLLNSCNYCGTGSATLTVQPNGDLYPCPNNIYESMKLGNIFENNIAYIWFKSPKLRMLRELNVDKNLSGKCHNCVVKHFCGGGCRGTTYQNTGDIHSLSITCEYEKQQRIEMLWALAKNPNLFIEESSRENEKSEIRLNEILNMESLKRLGKVYEK